MKPEQDNFDDVQRLLKLKRYEQPPPRYFSDFSTQVIRRIQTSTTEDRVTFLESLYAEAPWLQRLFGALGGKPAVAWTFGLATCALVVSGIVYSENVESTPAVALHEPGQAIHSQDASTPLMALGLSPSEPASAFVGSTDPSVQPVGTPLFDLIQPPSTQPVSFSLGGN